LALAAHELTTNLAIVYSLPLQLLAGHVAVLKCADRNRPGIPAK
jgi:glucosamine 6-phosphate synthetase-like amidotransferase/phosphosugar isomerase protein